VKAKAAVLEQFDTPLAIREFEVQPLAAGEALIKITAAGVCGSDVHMWHGNDPRTPLPIILGHEGVGEIADLGGERLDLLGRPLRPGDKVMWERGAMCGHCYYCVVRKQPSLCPHRKTYGISFSCAEPPHLRGCYAEYLHLQSTAHFLRIDDDIDPAVLVAASCSGATAAHAIELSRIRPGDAVLVVGPGPLGLFAVAMALKAGASRVDVVGTEVMGFDPRTVGYLWYLGELQGLRREDIHVVGEQVADCVTRYEPYKELQRILGWWVEDWKGYLDGDILSRPEQGA